MVCNDVLNGIFGFLLKNLFLISSLAERWFIIKPRNTLYDVQGRFGFFLFCASLKSLTKYTEI